MRNVEELERRLGHVFTDRGLLKRALTHASADSQQSNERLEFLGDRVLGLVIAARIFGRFPADDEGAMALKYNALVRRETCARVAEAAGVPGHLILAASEADSGGRRKAAILGGACEALIAALYLDGGMEAAQRFILEYWEQEFAALDADMRDAKTALQEWAQARVGRGHPEYRVVSREGPDHAPRFTVRVTVSGEPPQTGDGTTKREAEQAAAKRMLVQLGVWTR